MAYTRQIVSCSNQKGEEMIVTRKEAVELISGMLNNDINLEGEELEKVIFAVNEDIQVRDWMMGLPIKWSLEESIKFMQYMAVHTTAQDSVPFITVQAIFYYELGEHDKATQCLNYSLHMDSQYSLALLVKRVIDAGWPVGAFKPMRESVHPRVVEECFNEEGRQPIKKGDRSWQHTQ
jgi:hypothetical protein